MAGIEGGSLILVTQPLEQPGRAPNLSPPDAEPEIVISADSRCPYPELPLGIPQANDLGHLRQVSQCQHPLPSKHEVNMVSQSLGPAWHGASYPERAEYGPGHINIHFSGSTDDALLNPRHHTTVLHADYTWHPLSLGCLQSHGETTLVLFLSRWAPLLPKWLTLAALRRMPTPLSASSCSLAPCVRLV